MSMKYIRKAYRVDAARGRRIAYSGNGSTMIGTILSARDSYLRVRFDGAKRIHTLHPTWMVVYLTKNEVIK